MYMYEILWAISNLLLTIYIFFVLYVINTFFKGKPTPYVKFPSFNMG